jgi:hypothetical protein
MISPSSTTSAHYLLSKTRAKASGAWDAGKPDNWPTADHQASEKAWNP